jgi:ComF family protein
VLQKFASFCIYPVRDFIYPRICLVCEVLLHEDEDRICLKCWKSFTTLHPDHPTWKEIESKFTDEGFVNDLLSCYLFEKEGKLQDAIHLLKYQGMKAVGGMLGKEIGEKISTHPCFSKADFVVPIPLHKLKQRERGYNQSEFICKGISAITGIPVVSSMIVRRKYTQSQTQLSLIERKENVGDAFQIQSKYQSLIEGKTIILVDDVITTGATVNACAQQLRSYGASSVLAASVALAQ